MLGVNFKLAGRTHICVTRAQKEGRSPLSQDQNMNRLDNDAEGLVFPIFQPTSAHYIAQITALNNSFDRGVRARQNWIVTGVIALCLQAAVCQDAFTTDADASWEVISPSILGRYNDRPLLQALLSRVLARKLPLSDGKTVG
ncbi:hypothetical protein BaRGS_00000656 [Batillaria attramentaria]|uniref:Uncharacterized protein n=1 Tax=Batillaria attramentaria TaxID=370345 RepID=A0ABD0MA14_9CAEN